MSSISDNGGDGEAVELHRVSSIEAPDDKYNEKDYIGKIDKTYAYIGSTGASCFSIISQFKIEVVLFLYIFSYAVRRISSTSMIMDKVCIVHLKYSEEICSDLADYEDIKTEVEKLANNYHLGHSLIHMIPSCFIAIFIGSWSDKYGRKAPIIGALLGIIIDGIGATISAAIFNSRVEYYMISGIFTGLSGGFISVLTVIYSYISDTTKLNKRTMKYAIMEVAVGLSMPLGALAGGWIYKFLGYVPVFLISTIGHILALLWVVFVLEETRGLDNKDSWTVKFRNLWSFHQVVESVKATFKKRPNRGREQILAILIATCFTVLSFSSTVAIDYIYVHHRYDWDNTQYSTVSAIFSCISTISILVVVPIFKKIKLDDPALGIVGCISLLFKNISVGLADKVEYYFFGNLVGLFIGLTSLASKSRLSKVTSNDDLCKVFAFLTTVEFILPIISAAFVSQVFNATLSFYPGLVFLIFGCLVIIPLGIYIWLARLPTFDYEKMHNEQEENT